jgi:hypothetical protein
MRIENLLNETQFVNTMDEVSYKDLNSMELVILNKVYDGELDEFNANDRQAAVIDRLKDLMLIDDMGQVTPAGERMVQIFNQKGRRSDYTDRLSQVPDKNKPTPFDNRQRKWSDMGGDDQDLARKLKDI